MKKIIAYKTDVELTGNIINHFSGSINKYIKGWTSTCVHIDEFFKNGIPNDANAIVTLGILRGTGKLLKEAARIELDRYYIDHAYFEPGYNGKCWLRVSKNKHTINYLKEVSGYRWDKFFSKKITVFLVSIYFGTFVCVHPGVYTHMYYSNYSYKFFTFFYKNCIKK